MLGLVRAAATEIHGTTPIAREIEPQIAKLADVIDRLARTRGPWPEELRAEVRRLAVGTIEDPPLPPADRDALTSSILRAAADDLAKVVDGATRSPTVEAANVRRWHS